MLSKRPVQFALIGAFVALAGAIELFFFVSVLHMEKNIAFFLQTIISLESNFALNYLITWKGTRGSFWGVWFKYHIARAGTVIFNQGLYSAMVALGINYTVAYFAGVLIASVANFVVSEHVVFASHRPVLK